MKRECWLTRDPASSIVCVWGSKPRPRVRDTSDTAAGGPVGSFYSPSGAYPIWTFCHAYWKRYAPRIAPGTIHRLGKVEITEVVS